MRNLDRRLGELEEAAFRRVNTELNALLNQEVWPHISDEQLEIIVAGDQSAILALPAGPQVLELAQCLDEITKRNPKLVAVLEETES